MSSSGSSFTAETFVNGASIDWAAFGSRVARGGLYAAFWSVVAIIVAMVTQTVDALETVAADFGSAVNTLFSATALTNAFGTAAAALPSGVAGLVIALVVVFAVGYALEQGWSRLV